MPWAASSTTRVSFPPPPSIAISATFATTLRWRPSTTTSPDGGDPTASPSPSPSTTATQQPRARPARHRSGGGAGHHLRHRLRRDRRGNPVARPPRPRHPGGPATSGDRRRGLAARPAGRARLRGDRRVTQAALQTQLVGLHQRDDGGAAAVLRVPSSDPIRRLLATPRRANRSAACRLRSWSPSGRTAPTTPVSAPSTTRRRATSSAGRRPISRTRSMPRSATLAYPDGSYTREIVSSAAEIGFDRQFVVDYLHRRGRRGRPRSANDWATTRSSRGTTSCGRSSRGGTEMDVVIRALDPETSGRSDPALSRDLRQEDRPRLSRGEVRHRLSGHSASSATSPMTSEAAPSPSHGAVPFRLERAAPSSAPSTATP